MSFQPVSPFGPPHSVCIWSDGWALECEADRLNKTLLLHARRDRYRGDYTSPLTHAYRQLWRLPAGVVTLLALEAAP